MSDPSSEGTELLSLDITGMLTIRAGYAWDGQSGPGITIGSFMRASLVHDALYQLCRSRLLNYERERLMADRAMYNMCREDGMNWLLANAAYYAVRAFGRDSAWPSDGAM